MFDDDIHPQEYDDLMESSRIALRRDIENHIKKNRDGKTKITGDRVLVWDCSRLTEVETGEVNSDPLDHRLMANYESIVIEDSCKHVARVELGDNVYEKVLDIVVWNKTVGKKFRTSSDFSKIIS